MAISLKNHSKFDGCVCFYCEKKSKKSKGEKVPLHHSDAPDLKAEIQKVAEALDDVSILQKLKNLEVNQIIPYHNACRIQYSYKILEKRFVNDEWHEIREFHRQATTLVIDYVKKTVVDDKKPVLLKYLSHMYETKYKN